MQRCYSEKWHINKPSYKGCSVTKEWHSFMEFKRWMELQDWEGRQLDKDLLIKGNLVYSPDTCVFVSSRANSFLLRCSDKIGDLPVGVYLHKESGKYRAQCSITEKAQQKQLGCFDTIEEAENAYLIEKYNQAVSLAALQTDHRISEALLLKYKTSKEI